MTKIKNFFERIDWFLVILLLLKLKVNYINFKKVLKNKKIFLKKKKLQKSFKKIKKTLKIKA